MDVVLLTALAAVISLSEPESDVSAPEKVASRVAAEGPDVTIYRPEFFQDQRPSNALDMIGRIPGFELESGGGGRGLSGAAGNVLIDGKRPVSKSDGLGDVLRRIPAGQVVRIDLIRGGAPGIDMKGRSVVANVIRRRTDSLSGTVSASNVSVLGTRRNRPFGRIEAVRRLGDRVFEGSFDYRVGNGDDRAYSERVRTAADGTPLLASRSTSEGEERGWSAAAAAETPLLGGEVRANTRLYASADEGRDLEVRSLPAGERGSSGEYVGSGGEFGLRYDRELTEQASVQGVFLQQWRDSESMNSSGADTSARNERSGETVAGSVVRVKRSDELSFEAGAEVAYNWLEGASELIVGGVATPVPGSAAEVNEQRAESYGNVVWQPVDDVVIEAAVRYETSVLTARGTQAEFQFVKPMGALTWTPSPERQVRFRLDRQVGQLNFGDFLSSASLSTGFVTAGAAELSPTQVLRAEVVLEQRFWTEGALEISTRHEQLTDVIDRIPLVSGDRVFDARGNIGDGVRQVVEVSAAVPLDNLGLSGGLVEVGGSAQRSQVVDPTTAEERAFSGQSPYGWNASFAQDLPGLGLRYGVGASGGSRRVSYRFNGAETFEEEPYASAFVEYKPGGGFTVRGELNNLTARSSESVRAVHAGLRHQAPVDFVETREEQRLRTFRVSVSKVLDFKR